MSFDFHISINIICDIVIVNNVDIECLIIYMNYCGL
jgi:hypothetical protein